MKPINSTAQRISKLRNQLGLSQKEFAEKIGITQGAMSQLESGKSTLSLQTIFNINQAFGIDCNWLVLGEGHAAQKSATSTQISSMPELHSDKNKHFNWLAELNLIPLVKEEAHAGYIDQCQDQDYVESLDVYRIPGFESGRYRMFEIEGDSMLPAMHPGEIAVTELVSDWRSIENGTLCVVISKQGIVAKRIYAYLEDKSTFICKSDNPDYKSYTLPCEEVVEIWEIKAKITNLLCTDNLVSSERFQSIESDIMELKQQFSQIASPD